MGSRLTPTTTRQPTEEHQRAACLPSCPQACVPLRRFFSVPNPPTRTAEIRHARGHKESARPPTTRRLPWSPASAGANSTPPSARHTPRLRSLYQDSPSNASSAVTNCDNGTAVILATPDRGPNCGVEMDCATPVLDAGRRRATGGEPRRHPLARGGSRRVDDVVRECGRGGPDRPAAGVPLTRCADD